MDANTREVVWRQFGAAIDMLENAIQACPDKLWSDPTREPAFWYVAYHTLFFLDYYLADSAETFEPPAPFTLDELGPDGKRPERPYTKDELLMYLAHGRSRCRTVTTAMTLKRSHARRTFRWGEVSGSELLLYNMRHVQHHAAQLNLILRRETDSAPRWVAVGRRPPDGA